jgi:putative ABC transport system permease protein
MEHWYRESVAQPRFRTVILGAFSLLALIMASIGIYGVMNYLVIQRTSRVRYPAQCGRNQADILRQVLGAPRRFDLRGTCLGLGGSVFWCVGSRSLLFRNPRSIPLPSQPSRCCLQQSLWPRATYPHAAPRASIDGGSALRVGLRTISKSD